MRGTPDQGRYQRWLVRVGLALLVALALGYLPYRVLDGEGARRLDRLRGELLRERQRDATLVGENQALRRRIDGLRKRSDVIEDIAREELGMAHPGELVLRFAGDRAAPAPVASGAP